MQEGQELTDEDKFYLSWARETVKSNIALSNEMLKQLISLNSALLGVNLIFDKIVSSEGLKILVLLCFFVSLTISLLGLLPYENIVDTNSPSDIKEHKTKALKHKRIYLWTSACLLLLGFVIVIGDLTVKWFV
jgi:hypothetical protein